MVKPATLLILGGVGAAGVATVALVASRSVSPPGGAGAPQDAAAVDGPLPGTTLGGVLVPGEGGEPRFTPILFDDTTPETPFDVPPFDDPDFRIGNGPEPAPPIQGTTPEEPGFLEGLTDPFSAGLTAQLIGAFAGFEGVRALVRRVRGPSAVPRPPTSGRGLPPRVRGRPRPTVRTTTRTPLTRSQVRGLRHPPAGRQARTIGRAGRAGRGIAAARLLGAATIGGALGLGATAVLEETGALDEVQRSGEATREAVGPDIARGLQAAVLPLSVPGGVIAGLVGRGDPIQNVQDILGGVFG